LPRGLSFFSNCSAFVSLQADIQPLKTLPFYYFVFGCLTTESTLLQFQLPTLIPLAAPILVVCHMAFDHIYPAGPSQPLQQFINLGVKRLLTHGCPTQSNL
ncbi:copper homeostasis protein CutC, partial [Staphylococcus pseudintermedius]|uniref:copper homeostasis protein CutC n=1 Tax=Staphylococcus pseudintermedius TaxID=283734 RepID=UPI000E391BF4